MKLCVGIRDFNLWSRRKWVLGTSGMLRCLDSSWLPKFRDSICLQGSRSIRLLDLEYRNDMLFRKFCSKLRIDPRRANISSSVINHL